MSGRVVYGQVNYAADSVEAIAAGYEKPSDGWTSYGWLTIKKNEYTPECRKVLIAQQQRFRLEVEIEAGRYLQHVRR